jgi:hypothetical protein
MREPPIALLAALTLALCAPAATAGDREGLLLGGSFGFNGSNECDHCDLVAGPSYAFYAGWTVRPQLAVLGDLSLHAVSDGGEATYGYWDAVGAFQYWPIRWLWLGAGGGVSTTTSDDSGPIAVAQAGIDFRSRSRFGIDLRGRYERRVDTSDGRRTVAVSVGFTWY